MELRSLVDYMNVNFSLPKGSTTIDKEHISKADKEYLISTFPEWFVETTVEKEAADEAERLRIEALLAANLAGEESSNPFETNPETVVVAKEVEHIENQEAKFEISNSESKVKTKKK